MKQLRPLEYVQESPFVHNGSRLVKRVRNRSYSFWRVCNTLQAQEDSIYDILVSSRRMKCDTSAQCAQKRLLKRHQAADFASKSRNFAAARHKKRARIMKSGPRRDDMHIEITSGASKARGMAREKFTRRRQERSRCGSHASLAWTILECGACVMEQSGLGSNCVQQKPIARVARHFVKVGHVKPRQINI